ncbi:MAG: hypothetical protein LHV69_00310 [Elusimicrobia bacterium]|nr:hypothetical protein [Candidatus Obscuribacterium magneticum]MCB4755473.1 hypothetical protein [Candidatus Obscuribacterium magneticum]
MTRTAISHLAQQALDAMKRAVRKVLKEHKQLGQPIFVLKDGHVQRIPASKISYRPHRKATTK